MPTCACFNHVPPVRPPLRLLARRESRRRHHVGSIMLLLLLMPVAPMASDGRDQAPRRFHSGRPRHFLRVHHHTDRASTTASLAASRRSLGVQRGPCRRRSNQRAHSGRCHSGHRRRRVDGANWLDSGRWQTSGHSCQILARDFPLSLHEERNQPITAEALPVDAWVHYGGYDGQPVEEEEEARKGPGRQRFFRRSGPVIIFGAWAFGAMRRGRLHVSRQLAPGAQDPSRRSWQSSSRRCASSRPCRRCC